MAEEKELRPAKTNRLSEVLADDINEQDDMEDRHAKRQSGFVRTAARRAGRFMRKRNGANKPLTEKDARRLAKAVVSDAVKALAVVGNELMDHALESYEKTVKVLADAEQEEIEAMPVLTRKDRDARRNTKAD